MKRTCIQCNREFELTQSEIAFFKRKKLNLPKRCKECREQNKLAKQNAENASVTSSEAPEIAQAVLDTVKASYKKNKIITAAIIAVVAVLAVIGGIIIMASLKDSESKGDGEDADGAVRTTAVTTTYDTTSVTEESVPDVEFEIVYYFRNDEYLENHFEKHREDTGCETAWEYLERANAVIMCDDSLKGEEKSDGDDEGGDTVYYLEDTNEIVFVSEDGYIRTYFKPSRGYEYFEDNVA